VGRHLSAWLVYQDMGGTLLLGIDGEVYGFPHDAAEARPEADANWRLVAWVAACERAPELRQLLPARPPGTPDCPQCGGVGHDGSPAAGRLWCGACWGLGWRRGATMTEAEWAECQDPGPMLEFLQGKVSDRKLRLFACGCCRRVWDLLRDERNRKAVEAVEAFADGCVKRQALESVAAAADRAIGPVSLDSQAAEYAATASAVAAGLGPVDQVAAAAATAAAVVEVNWLPLKWDEEARQADLLRCIAGNPFRPVPVAPAWRTADALRLAQAIYDERAFDRLPILADALEEAGATDAPLLGHLRGPGPHVRGCWAVDLLLGKG
jgi:hypothetical protein